MEIKKFNGRFVPKGDTEANWNKAVGFIPLDKEIIIYKPDETHSIARFKVGDGKTGVQDLPFSGTDVEAIEKLIDEKGKLLIEYVDNAVAAIEFPQADYEQNDPTIADYIKNRPFYEKIYPAVTYDWNKDTLLQDYDYVQDNSIDVTNVGLNGYWVKISNDIPLADSFIGSKVQHRTAAGDVLTKTITSSVVSIHEENGTYIIKSGNPNSVDFGAILVIYDYELASSSLAINYPGNGIYIAYLDGYYTWLLSIELKEYHDIQQIDEKFIPSSIIEKNIEQDDKIAELEGIVTSFTCDTCALLPTDTRTVTLTGFTGVTKVNWGDGTVNNSLSHQYTGQHIARCKIYNATKFGTIDCDKDIHISDIVFSNQTTSIADKAFEGNIYIRDIVIPSSVATIGSHTFYNCSNVSSVILNEGLYRIGDNAFSYAIINHDIIIPSSVTYIGKSAFYNTGLYKKQIIFKSATPVTYHPDMFGGHSSISGDSNIITHIRVPYGCKQEYIDRWTEDGAPQDILDLITEHDKEVMMSDLINSTSDYEQNDSERLDYIKNRPFYEADNVILTTFESLDPEIISVNKYIDGQINLITGYCYVSDAVISREQFLQCVIDGPEYRHVVMPELCHTYRGFYTYDVSGIDVALFPQIIVVEQPGVNVLSSFFLISDAQMADVVLNKAGIYILVSGSYAINNKIRATSFIKKIDNKFLPNNNIENGSSTDSLQQKYSLAQGARSIALGGAITTPEAEKSLAMGASVAKNNVTFAANEYTTAEGWASATFGGQTKTSSPYMFACGFNNENKEENIFEVGWGENKYELVAERPTYEHAMAELKYYRNLGDKGYQRLTPINCPTAEDYSMVSEVFEFTGQGWNAFEVDKAGNAYAGGKKLLREGEAGGGGTKLYKHTFVWEWPDLHGKTAGKRLTFQSSIYDAIDANGITIFQKMIRNAEIYRLVGALIESWYYAGDYDPHFIVSGGEFKDGSNLYTMFNTASLYDVTDVDFLDLLGLKLSGNELTSHTVEEVKNV